MSAIATRESCLIERGLACAIGFERIGHRFSAGLMRRMIDALEQGAPGSLYDHWIAQQEQRLAAAGVADKDIFTRQDQQQTGGVKSCSEFL